MTKAQIAAAIQTIVRLQLDDSASRPEDGTKTIALNELEDAIRQLKLLAKRLEAKCSSVDLNQSAPACINASAQPEISEEGKARPDPPGSAMVT